MGGFVKSFHLELYLVLEVMALQLLFNIGGKKFIFLATNISI